MAASDGKVKTAKPESVWDYPRPPRLESITRRLRVIHQGVLIAETRVGIRILETSHPPVYYFPPNALSMQLLRPSSRRASFCEFKGLANYWDLDLTGATPIDGVASARALLEKEVAWSYTAPSGVYAPLRDYVAFYASRLDECWVDEERVVAQPGDFYGGWITSEIIGPFKGDPGTMGW